ncbi:MAG: hypothetical protein QNK43_09830, partial [Amphritea sp.]|nr:hypothetical protein [Amphritea sp.]
MRFILHRHPTGSSLKVWALSPAAMVARVCWWGLYLIRRVLGELCEPRQLHYCHWHQRCDLFFIVTSGAIHSSSAPYGESAEGVGVV